MKKYLFYFTKNYSIPIILPLVKLLKTTNNEYRFFVTEKIINSLPKEWDSERIFTKQQDAILFAPDFVLTPNNSVDFRIPGIKVQIFHGLGIEKKSHYVIRHFFDVYCTSGPVVTKQFNDLKRKHKYFDVLETGWPKVDHIINYNTTDLKTKLKIPENKKVILFAPTHSKKMQSAESLLPVIPKIIKENELWLMKFHELADEYVLSKFRNSANFRIISDYDITPYLQIADVLISDTSSVTYEFMLLNKPLITFRTQSRTDKGTDISSSNQLRKALDDCLNDSKIHTMSRDKHLEKVNPYLDGKICERLFSKLETGIFKECKKPLNLYRKMKILRGK